MKKIFAGLIVLVLLCQGSFCAQMDQRLVKRLALSSSDTISVIVKVRDVPIVSTSARRTLSEKIAYHRSVSEMSQKSAIGSIGARHRRVKQFWSFNAFSADLTRDEITKLSKRADVEKIYENRPVHLLPFDEGAPVSTFASTVESNLSLIKADQVWSGYGYKGKGIKVGIADTGITSSHPDFAGRISAEAEFNSAGDKVGNYATDDSADGHGTHVCGIIAGGNSSGTSIGVAPEASLVVAKVFTRSGSASTSNSTQAISGVEWLISNEAKIINLSLGGATGDAEEPWKIAADRWASLGILVVAAIGNDPAGTESPGNVPSVLGVGAVDNSDLITYFSGRGGISWYGTPYIKPDIMAPGLNIKSSVNTGGYALMSGTSMASPHVAGIAALLLSARPSLTAEAIKAVLKQTTYKRGDQTYANNNYGNGRVDALAAVNSILSDVNPPVITHTAVTTGKYLQSIAITAIVTDDASIPAATLYFKKGLQSWSSTTMSRSGSTYSCSIASTDVTGDIQYYIKAVDFSGQTAYAPTQPSVYTISVEPADLIEITQALSCPNPFAAGSQNASITFSLSKPADISVSIYTITGEKIWSAAATGQLGYNAVDWNGIAFNAETAANGVYIYQITARDIAGGKSAYTSGKIIVLK